MENISIIAQIKVKRPTDLFGTITIRGFYNRKPVASKSTGYKIHIDHWDPNNRCVNSYAPNAKLINTCINMKLQEMKASLMKKEIAGYRLNSTAVIKAVKGITDRDFIAFCLERIREDYTSKETIRSYEAECSKLQKFKKVISFADIDFLFLTKYKNYMLNELKNDENTVWKSFKFLNTMLNKSLNIGGIILENPFKQFDRGKYHQKQRTWLELLDCDKIEKIAIDEYQPVIIKKVAIRFLLMCYSGMRFSDAITFNPDKHVINDERIIMSYQKFNSTVNNLMWERLRKVVDVVKNDSPLHLSNQKFNQWLKVIGTLTKIKINLTTHLGRHTLGSLLAEAEIPIETSQIILGHKDIRSTRIYYHQKAKNNDKAMEKLNELK